MVNYDSLDANELEHYIYEHKELIKEWSIRWMNRRFARMEYWGVGGWRVYKCVSTKTPYGVARPSVWKSAPGMRWVDPHIDVNPNHSCGSGINVATIRWLQENYLEHYPVVPMFVPEDVLFVVPFVSDGKLRVREAVCLERPQPLSSFLV